MFIVRRVKKKKKDTEYMYSFPLKVILVRTQRHESKFFLPHCSRDSLWTP